MLERIRHTAATRASRLTRPLKIRTRGGHTNGSLETRGRTNAGLRHPHGNAPRIRRTRNSARRRPVRRHGRRAACPAFDSPRVRAIAPVWKKLRPSFRTATGLLAEIGSDLLVAKGAPLHALDGPALRSATAAALLCRDCRSHPSASCRPDPRQPASAPGSRSRGRAATLVNPDLAPGPDDLGKGGGGLRGDARLVVEIVRCGSEG